MTEILNEAAVAAVVEAARSAEKAGAGGGAGAARGGAAGTAGPPLPWRRSRRVRAVDFTHPTKFSPEQERRIARAVDAFCQTAQTRLSAELRVTVELEVINREQLTWSHANRLLPAGSLAAVLDVQPIASRMLLAADLTLVLTAIECLTGGSPKVTPKPRRLTDIDWALAGRLIDATVNQLSTVWSDLAGLELSMGSLAGLGDTNQIAPVSEPTLCFLIDARIAGGSATLALLIPWAAIEPVAETLSGSDGNAPAPDEHVRRTICDAVSQASVTLRAQVPEIVLSMTDVLELTAGSVLNLGHPASSGVQVFIEDVLLAAGTAGRCGQRRAVRIGAPAEAS